LLHKAALRDDRGERRDGWKGDIRWEYYFFPIFAEKFNYANRDAVSIPRPAVGGDEVIE
jgi:hypothetical protein